MRVIIAGSRSITDQRLVDEAIQESQFKITEVVCGGARGVDTLGLYWAWSNRIPVKTFLAEWGKFGKSAGYRRNLQMADYAEALIAVTNGSKGTGHMIDIAKSLGMPVYVKSV